MKKSTLLVASVCLVVLVGAGTQLVLQSRMKTRMSPELRQQWETRIEKKRQIRDSALTVARRSRANGDINTAASAYRDALAAEVDLPEINREMGDMFLAQGQLKEAETAYLQGATATQDPHHGYGNEHSVLFRLAAFYAQTGKPELALKWAHMAMDIRYPDTNKSPVRQKNLPPDVIPHLPNFRPVAEDMPKLRAFTHAQIAKDFGTSGRREDLGFALREYKNSVLLDPDSPWQTESWASLGWLAYEQHDGTTATEAYKQGLKLAMKHGDSALAERCEDGLKRIESTISWNKEHPEKPYKLAFRTTGPKSN